MSQVRKQQLQIDRLQIRKLRSRKHDQPNLILIFADDLGIEALNAHGGRGVETPHLDKLASNGMCGMR